MISRALPFLVLISVALGCSDSGQRVCYSPTQNVDKARESEIIGCACDPVRDRDVCVQGTALFCVDHRWNWGYDGPCMPGPDGGVRRDSAVDLPWTAADAPVDQMSTVDADVDTAGNLSAEAGTGTSDTSPIEASTD